MGSLDISLVNCKIELDLSWPKDCIIFAIFREAVNPAEAATLTTGAIYQTNIAKVYVPRVTLPIYNNSRFLEYLNQGFKRTTSWNRYSSKDNNDKM